MNYENTYKLAKRLFQNSNSCKNEFSHEVTKIEASQGVLLAEDSIFDQIVSHFCVYSLLIRVLAFEYSYDPEIEDS